jgi:hypothetical protein
LAACAATALAARRFQDQASTTTLSCPSPLAAPPGPDCSEVGRFCVAECRYLLGRRRPGNYGSQDFFACKAHCMRANDC